VAVPDESWEFHSSGVKFPRVKLFPRFCATRLHAGNLTAPFGNERYAVPISALWQR
jgi:hypothetical protein